MIVSSVIHMLDPPVFYGDVLHMDVYVPEISFSDIYLSFKYLHSSLLILDSLLSPYSAVSFIMYFGYRLPL